MLSLKISNPILISSSPFTDGKRNIEKCLELGVGGVVTKTIYIGNDKPNKSKEEVHVKGYDVFNTTTYSKYNPEIWYGWFAEDFKMNNNIIPNIYGDDISTILDYVIRLEQLDIDTIELGISCPSDTLKLSSEEICELIHNIKLQTSVDVIVKLTADSQIYNFSNKFIEAGVDALTVSDTLPSVLFSKNGNINAGYSGRAIKPIVLHSISSILEEHPEIPIFGVGGIQTLDDIEHYFSLGCSYIQLCSLIYVKGFKKTKELIDRYINKEGEKN